MLAILMIFNGQVAFALQVRVKEQINIRTHSANKMVQSGKLLKGSIVQIPDKYTVYNRTTNKPDLDLTLNNWLRDSKNLTKDDAPGNFQFKPNKFDFFFPVEVISTSPGSVTPSDKPIFIALKSLAKKNRNLLEVVEDAPIYAENIDATAPHIATDPLKFDVNIQKPQISDSEIAAGLTPETCTNCDQTNPIISIISFLPKTLMSLAQALSTKSNNISKNLNTLATSFEKSCNAGTPTKKYSDFLKIIDKELNGNPEMRDLLISKLAIESRGLCFNNRPEHNGSKSIGLFQINTKSSKYKTCSSEQNSQIRNASFTELENNYQCLDNPIVSLRESTRILKQKEQALFQGSEKFDINKVSLEDKQKLLVAAYNGGETHVLSARRNLVKFVEHNRSKGVEVNLNPNSWEDLKVFFFRGALNENEQRIAFGEYRKSKRTNDFTISNIAHTEALVNSIGSVNSI